MKNIVSFCLYGSKAIYILGMKENILLGKKYFPTWEIRIYHNDTVPEKFIKEYCDIGAICIKCENIGKNKMNWEGMLWRVLPLHDNDVHFWISRDADSRLSKREADIVNQWMQSGKTLHCIRDHRCHYHAIMGGMFGINNKSFHAKYKFKKISDIISDLYKLYKERPYNVDQEFLNSQVWNLLKYDVMAHISNKGRRIYKSDIEIPSVPEFIGKQYRIQDTTSIKPNFTSIDLVNKTFKIKNLYNDYCFDIVNNKVKLKKISNSNSQIWEMDDKSRIKHCTTNTFLDYDNNNDLILSTNSQLTWNIHEGGFIENNKNNMVIDFKGGIKDKRLEVWLFKLNYTEAQQWDIVFENNNITTSTTKESYERSNKSEDIQCIDTKTNINDFFDQIYVIHLNELLDRKKIIIEQLQKYIGKKMNVTIIDAINKNTINKDTLIQNELVGYPGNNNCKNVRINDKPEPLPSPNGYKCWCNNRGHNDLINYTGRIACALGHLLVYEDIVKNKYEKCLILEDDFIFSSEINNVFNTIVPDIPDNWELLFFAHSKKIRQKHKNVNSSFVFCGFYGGMCNDSSCYALNNKAANELFDNIFPLKSASDGYLCSIVDRRFKLTNAYICKKSFGCNATLSNLLKSVNDNNIIEESSKDEIENYNNILKSMVNKYDKNNINDIISKYSLKSCVPSIKDIENNKNIYTITTSIPSEIFVDDIDSVIKHKKVDMYDGIKDRTIGGSKYCQIKKRYVDTYDFNNQEHYYNAYREAKWGFTKKKNGWDCLRHYEIIANGCLPLFENLEDCPENTLSGFPKQLLIEAKNKKDTMTDNEYNYYLKTIFNYFKENFTCEIVAEKFLKQIHKDNKKNISDVKILLLHGNQCNNYMSDLLFIGLRRLLKENIVDENKLVELYKSFSGKAYGKGFTYTKRLSDELVIDRKNIEEKLRNKFFDYIIYRKCGGDEGELGDCRKKMEYWDIVDKVYDTNEIVFLYGGDRMSDMNIKNRLSEHLKYHSHKGLCFVREYISKNLSTRNTEYMKTLKFIHITKNAGTSIENYGKNYCWGKFHKEYNAIGYHTRLNKLPSELKQKYDWFIIVRNPYTRIVSEMNCKYAVNYNNRLKNHSKKQLNQLLRQKIQEISHNKNCTNTWDNGHFLQQYLYTQNVEPNEKLHILKYENLNEEFQQLMKKYNLNVKLGNRQFNNPENKIFELKDLDDESIKLIQETYINDFKQFNYDTMYTKII